MKMHKKYLSVFLIIVLMVSFVTGCSSKDPVPVDTPEGQEKEVIRVSVGAGSSGGQMYIQGSGWATVLNNKLKDQYEITTEETGGSVANMGLIESGEAEFSFGMASNLADALHGTGSWTNGVKYVKPRVIIPCSPISIVGFSLKKSNIETLQDVNGKIVGLGSKGAGVDESMRKNFKLLGIEPASIYNDTWSACADALSDGIIDVLIGQQTPPWPPLQELEATHDVQILEFTQEELDIMQEANPYYLPQMIPKGTYKANEDFDIHTLAEWSYIQSSIDVPEDIVYDIVKASFESYDELIVIHPSFKTMTFDSVEKLNILWHPGAIKYFEEQGIKVQDPDPIYVVE